MTEKSFSFKPHLDLAHQHWRKFLSPGDLVVDATCGNGHDSLVLANIVLRDDQGSLIVCDIQKQAIDNTKKRLKEHLSVKQFSRVKWRLGCHSNFHLAFEESSAKGVIYNLGYLPGGDKSITTRKSSTIKSVQEALRFVANGGIISITCYPGHAEGAVEAQEALDFVSRLSSRVWNCFYYRQINRLLSPFILFLHKK